MRISVVCVLLFCAQHFSLGHAQTEPADTARIPGTVASPIPQGIYQGEVMQTGGQMRSDGRPRSSQFTLDLMQNPGTLSMHLAMRPCHAKIPIAVTGVKDGVIRLEQNLAQGGISGCDRIFELTVKGNDLAGTMTSSGSTYSVKATRQ